MTYKIQLRRDPVGIEFETGSLAEAHSILTDEQGMIAKIFNDFADGGESVTTTVIPPGNTEPGAVAPTGKKRGRRSNAEIAADAAAAASAPPPPVPAPAAPPPPPVALAPAPMPVPPAPAGAAPPLPPPVVDGMNLPAFLKRDENNALPADAPAVVAPPPPAPPAPPAPVPAAPAPSPLRDAVVADIRKRITASVDQGAEILTWLVKCGIIGNGATVEETYTVLQFATEAQTAQLAAALQVKV